MRILQLHCDSIEYTPTQKEIDSAEEITPETQSLSEVLVDFVAIEDGDNSDTALQAAGDITESAKRLGCTRILVYPYAHLSSKLASPKTALQLLRELESAIDASDVTHAPFGWTKSYSLKVKAHPLAESLRVFGGGEKKDDETSSALKSESKLESTWHVITPDGELHDATKFDFGQYKRLRTLFTHEESGTRKADDAPPHVALMKKLGIADYEPASDSGNMRYFPNGRLVKSLIERYVTESVRAYGASEVETPIMYDSAHPSMKSYFDRFPARQYSIDAEGRSFFLRFAACFGQFLMAAHAQLSHHNLPYRLYELTRYSFRREQSGELVGLRRLRAFTMPDCHAFCADMNQAISELETRLELSRNVISGIGIAESDYEMSIRLTRPFYEENRELVARLAKKHGKPILVEMWSERFFYFVLKWEFNYIDATGKASALSTDQIDVENGKRYNIEFADADGSAKNPIILHNSPSGAVERVIYALLENAARDSKKGKKPSLPLWLAPTQVRVIPITSEFLEYSKQVADMFTAAQIRADIDDRNESIGKRIRAAEKEWVHYILVVGKAEAESDQISVRERSTDQTSTMSSKDLISLIAAQTSGMPASTLNVAQLLSARPQIMI